MILALLSLYPFLVAVVGFLTAGMLVISTSMNVVLTTLCIALYMMIPRGSFDHWFSSVGQLVQMMFPDSYGRIQTNLKKTFQYHEKAQPDRAFYLWHPHGLLSVTPFLHTFIQQRSKIVCLSFFHRVPIVRDLYHYIRAIPSDYDTIKTELEEGSVSIIPGGVREMMLPQEAGVLRTIIKCRKGLFRLALETGTPLVPVLTYGEHELFPQVDSSLLTTLNQWMYSQFGLYIPIPSFTSLLNWVQLSETPLPPIRSVAGSPIPVEKVETPTQEQIEALKTTYCSALQKLFDETAPSGLRLVME